MYNPQFTSSRPAPNFRAGVGSITLKAEEASIIVEGEAKIESNVEISGDLCITGDLMVDGLVTCVGLNKASIVKEVMEALPWGTIDKCHGCDQPSFGFVWDAVNEKQKKVERQMCLECLYQGMLVESARKRDFDKERLDK